MKEVRFNDKLWFSKHKGSRISDVIRNDPSFIQKLLKENKIILDRKTMLFFEKRCGTSKLNPYEQENRIDLMEDTPMDRLRSALTEPQIGYNFHSTNTVRHTNETTETLNRVRISHRLVRYVLVPNPGSTFESILDMSIAYFKRQLLTSDASRQLLNDLFRSCKDVFVEKLRNSEVYNPCDFVFEMYFNINCIYVHNIAPNDIFLILKNRFNNNEIKIDYL